MSAIGQKPPARTSFINKVTGLFTGRKQSRSAGSAASISRSSSFDSQDAYAQDGQKRQPQDQGLPKGAQDMANALGANLKRSNATASKRPNRAAHSDRSSSPAAQTPLPKRPALPEAVNPAQAQPKTRIDANQLPHLSPLDALARRFAQQSQAPAKSTPSSPVSENDMDLWSKM
jgi:hypothetical protein